MLRRKPLAEMELDTSHPDVGYLLEYVADLEGELYRARDYLEACRPAAGAREGELLIDAIRRRIVDRSEPAVSRRPSGRPCRC